MKPSRSPLDAVQEDRAEDPLEDQVDKDHHRAVQEAPADRDHSNSHPAPEDPEADHLADKDRPHRAAEGRMHCLLLRMTARTMIWVGAAAWMSPRRRKN